ncbi:MAG: hypothetical protein H8D97_00110 [Proteobacteria bacterium]|nr:hypothetical protein [Pseudomonadota bacterium]
MDIIDNVLNLIQKHYIDDYNIQWYLFPDYCCNSELRTILKNEQNKIFDIRDLNPIYHRCKKEYFHNLSIKSLEEVLMNLEELFLKNL